MLVAQTVCSGVNGEGRGDEWLARRGNCNSQSVTTIVEDESKELNCSLEEIWTRLDMLDVAAVARGKRRLNEMGSVASAEVV